ncbi:MAG: N-acetylglucosamine-6-phosphate deacetylase [Candidatus Aminicenantes bacterium]|nr:N-acetylglucosamine-6-phosphate deacetylase [Candidatus Aminicenantes bacterium]NIT27022.1 N-acetylglucosamine-6-phosphate deacetylase [Candidatus Aminicenantes bacterium]
MGSFSLSAGEIITPFKKIKNGVITVENGIITEIRKRENEKISSDFSESIIVPGFIDVHIHGIAGVDVMDATVKSIDKMRKSLLNHGVTAFCPTLDAAPLDQIKNALKTINVSKKSNARSLGAHLEGPFLNPEKPGAMIAKNLRTPSIDEFDELWNASEKSVKLTTIAPEVPGAIELIKHASSLGVTVSLGHSNATYEEALAGIKAGASHATHLFNAMRAYHHREPGILGAVLENPKVSVELIMDLVHVHPSITRLVCKLKPKDKVIIVTDAIRATDMPDGVYENRYELHVKNGEARLPDGTLAGSTLTLDKALRNLVFKLGVPLKDAVTMMTVNPAKNIRVDDEIGSIEVGKRADFAILDKNLNLIETIVGGEIVFENLKPKRSRQT